MAALVLVAWLKNDDGVRLLDIQAGPELWRDNGYVDLQLRRDRALRLRAQAASSAYSPGTTMSASGRFSA